MNRRDFLGLAAAAALANELPSSFGQTVAPKLKPMELGLLIVPFGAPEEHVRTVHDLGFSNCFLSLDGYIGGFTPGVVSQFRDLLAKYAVTVTTVEVVGPGIRKWNFTEGPATIGLVPQKTRTVTYRRSSATLGFCETARRRPGADALRVYSGRPHRCALSRSS